MRYLKDTDPGALKLVYDFRSTNNGRSVVGNSRITITPPITVKQTAPDPKKNKIDHAPDLNMTPAYNIVVNQLGPV